MLNSMLLNCWSNLTDLFIVSINTQHLQTIQQEFQGPENESLLSLLSDHKKRHTHYINFNKIHTCRTYWTASVDLLVDSKHY